MVFYYQLSYIGTNLCIYGNYIIFSFFFSLFWANGIKNNKIDIELND